MTPPSILLGDYIIKEKRIVMKEVMLTTFDNPFNPFEQFDEWEAFDV